MKKQLKSKITKLILSICVFLTLFNFITPNIVLASDGWQGALIEPITDFVCSIGDMAINFMQGFMMPGSPKAVTVRSKYDQLTTMDGDVSIAEWWTGFIMGFYAEKDENWIGEIGKAIGRSIMGVATFGMSEAMGTANQEQITKWFKQEAYPLIYYGPAAIFTNRVPGLDINFINPASNFNKQYAFLLMFRNVYTNIDDYIPGMMTYWGLTRSEAEDSWKWLGLIKNVDPSDMTSKREFLSGTINVNNPEEGTTTEEGNPVANSAIIIGPIISKWYIALRNVAIVGLLIVLVYIGIRILISSVSEEAAKYKMMLKDWVVAMVIVFLIHYIMLGLLTINEAVIDALDDSAYGNVTQEINNQANDILDQFTPEQAERVEQAGLLVENDSLMNTVRIRESMARASHKQSETGWLDTFGYALMYLVLVIYTIIFTFKYLKRLIYMAFLTIIAPMVALTYPIDKAGDKRAQAFNMWFKEYLFNLLIQPIHLLLYIVLVGSALNFATANILYGIVAIGFIMEAEQFVKAMFGINAEGGAFGQFAAGALFAQGLNIIGKGASKIGGSGKGGKKTGNEDSANTKIRQQNMKDPSAKGGLAAAFGNNNEDEEQRGPSDGGNGDSGTSPSVTGPTEEGGAIPGGTPGNGGLDSTRQREIPPIVLPQPAESQSSNPQKGRIRKGIKNVLGLNPQQKMFQGRNRKRVIRGVGRTLGKGARFVGKSAVRLGSTAALGSVGLAIGLASGEGVGKYTAVGLVAGNALGKAINNTAGGAWNFAKNTGKNVAQTYRNGAYTKEENQIMNNAKLREQFMMDKEVDKEFKEQFGERAEEMKENYLEAARYGMPDDVALKLMEKGVDPQKAMAASDVVKNDITRQQLSDPNSPEYKALRKRLMNITGGNENATRDAINVFDQAHGLSPDEMNTLRQNAQREQLAEEARIKAEQEAAEIRAKEEQARIINETVERKLKDKEIEARHNEAKSVSSQRNPQGRRRPSSSGPKTRGTRPKNN